MATKMVTARMSGDDTAKVSQELVQKALAKLGEKEISCVLLFLSRKYHLETFISTVRGMTKGAPLIGCTSAGEFNEEGDDKEGAVITLISSDSHKFYTALGNNLKEDPIVCLQEAATKLPQEVEGFPFKSAILLHDGLVGSGEEAVMAATLALGPTVNFAGGSAADDLNFVQTYVFVDDAITVNSVGLCLIASKQQPVIGMQHGHKPATETFVSTKATGSVLNAVNETPAWDVWKEALREKAKELDIDVDQLKTEQDIGQFLIRYELGLSMGDNYKVRVPLSKNEDGSLNFACTIPEGASFKIMESTIEDQILSAEIAAKNAYSKVRDVKLAGALVFDCVCRGIILGDDFYKGVEKIKKVIGNIPLAGFETYGEICMEPGQFSGYHNTSTVVMLLPE